PCPSIQSRYDQKKPVVPLNFLYYYCSSVIKLLIFNEIATKSVFLLSFFNLDVLMSVLCARSNPRRSNVYGAILLRLQMLSFYLINFENSVCAPKEVYMDYYRLIRETAAYFI